MNFLVFPVLHPHLCCNCLMMVQICAQCFFWNGYFLDRLWSLLKSQLSTTHNAEHVHIKPAGLESKDIMLEREKIRPEILPEYLAWLKSLVKVGCTQKALTASTDSSIRFQGKKSPKSHGVRNHVGHLKIMLLWLCNIITLMSRYITGLFLFLLKKSTWNLDIRGMTSS